VTDSSNLERQAAEQRKRFQETHGYPAVTIPDAWVGQNVTMNIVGGRSADRHLAPEKSSGMLEAVREDGFVISTGERTVFIPAAAVLQMELYDPDRRNSTVSVRG
jgi:hypothetical protein